MIVSSESKIAPYEYSSRFETRVANRAGEIKFKSKSYRLSEVFIDEQVGLTPSDTEMECGMCFTAGL